MAKMMTRLKTSYANVRRRHFDKFIFIHINKTGGSSIEKALNLPLEHKTALEKIAEIGRKEWDRRFTFAVARNPWDKVVSHYHYRVQTNQTSLGDDPIGFAEWVCRAYGERDPAYYDKPKMFMPQTDWVADESGNIIVDRILHFENLNDEFAEIKPTLKTNVDLPHLKTSKRGNYRDYYDDETTGIIRDWFQKDIEQFGYEF